MDSGSTAVSAETNEETRTREGEEGGMQLGFATADPTELLCHLRGRRLLKYGNVPIDSKEGYLYALSSYRRNGKKIVSKCQEG